MTCFVLLGIGKHMTLLIFEVEEMKFSSMENPKYGTCYLKGKSWIDSKFCLISC